MVSFCSLINTGKVVYRPSSLSARVLKYNSLNFTSLIYVCKCDVLVVKFLEFYVFHFMPMDTSAGCFIFVCEFDIVL